MMAKALSRLNPLALLVIAIDGSDQSSYATPYFSQVTKDSCVGQKQRSQGEKMVKTFRWEHRKQPARTKAHHQATRLGNL